jgi:hypothetical protein
LCTTASASPVAVVHKNASCGCCSGHEEHLRAHGYAVEEVVYHDGMELRAMKADLGVPDDAQSCHTTIVGGYVVEGHVPAPVIDELLAERPAIDGIALPGMPGGAPGMPGNQVAPFEIMALSGGEASPHTTYQAP